MVERVVTGVGGDRQRLPSGVQARVRRVCGDRLIDILPFLRRSEAHLPRLPAIPEGGDLPRLFSLVEQDVNFDLHEGIPVVLRRLKRGLKDGVHFRSRSGKWQQQADDGEQSELHGHHIPDIRGQSQVPVLTDTDACILPTRFLVIAHYSQLISRNRLIAQSKPQ